MRTFIRQVIAYVTRDHAAFEPPSRSETDLRAAFTTLAERWEQMADRAPTLPTSLYVDPLTPAQIRQYERAVGYRTAASDVRDVLRTGHVPHALMTDDELEQYGTKERAS